MTIRRPFARTKTAAAALAVCLGAGTVAASTALAAPADFQNYYVDCSAGTNGSGSQTSPWNSLANAPTFGPGDQLLFKGGARCVGTLTPQGSGSSSARLVFGAYGTSTGGAVIDGNGALSAIHLFNSQYITPRDLEIINAANPGTVRRGIDVELRDFGTGNEYTLQNLNIHDIWGDDVGVDYFGAALGSLPNAGAVEASTG